MSRAHYFYSTIPETDLTLIVEDHQKRFDDLIGDTFDDDELAQHEKMLDSIAAIYVQPLLSELSFDDFYPDPENEEDQRKFFSNCKSTLLLENLPYFESNPFQVSYLLQLLSRLEEVLVDRGGVNELVFKEQYLQELKKYKTMDSLIPVAVTKPATVITSRPVDPIDFLILDVYKEIDRLKGLAKLPPAQEESSKVQKILQVMKDERLDALTLLRKCGLNAKDFDDNLERLKFYLRKIT